jgi:CHAT domain-containing protein
LAYQKEGKWEDAEETIDQSLDLLDLLLSQNATATESQRRVRALALNNQGLLLLAVGKAKEAFEVWQDAAADYQALGEVEAVSGVQLNQALALSGMGYYRRSCDLLLDTMGMEGLTCDDLEVSEAENEQNQSEASQPDNPQDDLELTEQEKRQLKEIQELFAQQPNSGLKVTGLRSLGNVLRAIGSLKESELILQESLTVAQSLNSSEAIAQSAFELGNTYQALAKRYQNFSEYENTKKYRRRGIRYYLVATQKGTQAIALSARVNQLNLLLDDGINELINKDVAVSRQEAEALLPEIETLLNSVPISQTAVKAKINFGCTVLGCDRLLKGDRLESPLLPLNDIEDLFNQAVESAKQLGGDRLISYALGTLAKLDEYQLLSASVKQSKNHQNYSHAKELTQQALNFAEQSNAPDIAYQWQWQMGRLLEAEAELEHSANIPDSTAVSYYEQSLETLQTLRQDMAALNSDIQFNFRDRVEPVYRQYVDLLLRPENPQQKDLETARQTIENLQLAELDNFFQDACVESTEVKIDEIDPHAAVIYPIILKDRLEVLVKLPGEDNLIHHANFGVSEEKVDQVVSDLQKKLIAPRTIISKLKTESNDLYNWLIKPFAQSLDWTSSRENSHLKNLVFVLDKSLRNIPMTIIYDDNDKILLDRYAIATTPGLQLLDSQPLIFDEINALISGASNADSFKKKQLGKLPYVKDELDGITEKLLTTTNLIEDDFLKNKIQTEIQNNSFNVIHLATHGKFSSNPDETFILDWNEPIQVKELNGLLQGNNGNPANIELLVLSACQTATGDNRAALGLAGVAIRSGARSTIASLWQISDPSTAEFMKLFYQELKNKNITKSEALRNAQLTFFRDEHYIDKKDYNRPYYWAAFTLVGNWL